MILIPYSKCNYRSTQPIGQIKQTLIDEYEGEIDGNKFLIIERAMAWNMRMKISGQLLQEQEYTKIITTITFHFSAWILLILIAISTLGLAGGIFLYSKVSGELDVSFWALLGFNIFIYLLYLVVYQIKVFFKNKFLMRDLSASRINE